MLPSPSAPVASRWLPGLANRGVAYTLLALGLAGLLTEVISTAFAPRLVLFLTVLAFGVLGHARCRRIDQRAIRHGSRSPGSR